MKLIIYQNSKSATQSGKKNTGRWFIKFVENQQIRSKDPLMNWTSCSNNKSQLKLEFASKNLAEQFAKKQGFDYVIQTINPKAKIRKKSYESNFTKTIF